MKTKMIIGQCVMALSLLMSGSPVFGIASIGEAADNLMPATEIVTKVLLYGCYVIGVGLCLGALVQYKQHRQNPKLVPLTTPLIMMILGLTLFFLPYFTGAFGDTWSAAKVREEERAGQDPQAGRLALPPIGEERRLQQAIEEEEASLVEDDDYEEDDSGSFESPSRSGGHWSQDPRYR